jgi:hypothetical protein
LPTAEGWEQPSFPTKKMLTRHRILLTLFSTVEPLARIFVGMFAMTRPWIFLDLLSPELSLTDASPGKSLAWTMTRLFGVVLTSYGMLQGAAIGLASPKDANLIGHVLLMAFVGDSLMFGMMVIHSFSHSKWTVIPGLDGWHRPTHIGPLLAFVIPIILSLCRYAFMNALGQRVVNGLENYPAHLKPYPSTKAVKTVAKEL